MFSNTARVCGRQRDIFRDVVSRCISKTSNAPSIDAFASRNSAGDETNATTSQWSRLNKYNNQRALSTIKAKVAPETPSPYLTSKEENREFMSVFPDIVRDLTERERYADIPEVCKWYAKVLQYNVPNGKKNRGLSMVAAYKMLESPENLTQQNVRLANILGWCVEMLQAYFLVVDDIIDGSKTRRGEPCWYSYKDVGLAALNDSVLIEQGIFTILKKHFSKLPMYVPTVELFHETILKTSMGQCLDIMSAKGDKLNLDHFTMKKYEAIVKYKTSFYSCALPVALGMYLANKFDPEMHRQAKTILLEMGQFFQIQDDFLDCFGDTTKTGKVNNGDICEGKCSWLIVVALQRATPSQRALLENHYGKSEPESINIVRRLYEELNLPNTYLIYEEESYNRIKTHIQQISKGLPHDLFLKFLQKMYKREG